MRSGVNQIFLWSGKGAKGQRRTVATSARAGASWGHLPCHEIALRAQSKGLLLTVPHSAWHSLVGEESQRVETHQSWDAKVLLGRRKGAGSKGTGKGSLP